MSERDYRKRLEADLARWEADGLIAASAGAAIRATLRPVPEGVTIATVVAIAGGLLIAAAFLAFVAANWSEIPRPTRFGILLAGIASAYVFGAWFDRSARPYLADLAVAVGSIVFGAAIALTGQMYHLGDDFAGGMLLLAAGSLITAVLTSSRGRARGRARYCLHLERHARVRNVGRASAVCGVLVDLCGIGGDVECAGRAPSRCIGGNRVVRAFGHRH